MNKHSIYTTISKGKVQNVPYGQTCIRIQSDAKQQLMVDRRA